LGVGLLRVRGGRWRYADDDRPGALPGLAAVRPQPRIITSIQMTQSPNTANADTCFGSPTLPCTPTLTLLRASGTAAAWNGRGTATTAAAAGGCPHRHRTLLTPATCTGTGLTPATSSPGLGSPPPPAPGLGRGQPRCDAMPFWLVRRSWRSLWWLNPLIASKDEKLHDGQRVAIGRVFRSGRFRMQAAAPAALRRNSMLQHVCTTVHHVAT
jgi:hypothetical protein